MLGKAVDYHARVLRKQRMMFIEDYYHTIRTHASLGHEPPVIDLSTEKPLLTLDVEIDPSRFSVAYTTATGRRLPD